MTDSEIDAIATGILLLANEEKWYEQKERIRKAISDAYFAGCEDGACEVREPLFNVPSRWIGQSAGIPRDFIPGHRQVNEEG